MSIVVVSMIVKWFDSQTNDQIGITESHNCHPFVQHQVCNAKNAPL